MYIYFGLCMFWCYFNMIFSSPEPKAHWWAYRVGRPPSSVWLSSTHFKIFSSETWLGRFKPNFIWSLHWMGEWKFVQTVLVTWPKMAAMPIYGKNLKKKSSSTEPKDGWPWNLVCSIGCLSTTKFVQMMTLGWPWPILQQGQIWSLMLLYRKKVKQWIFQKLFIVVYDLKLATDARSDKKFLLTSKLCPLEAVCPLPRGYTVKPVSKSHLWEWPNWLLYTGDSCLIKVQSET